jgi:aarF domain-containing kinase
MDLPEARISVLDADFPSELRTVRINRIPTDVFMIIRVIAIFRGIFTTVGADIHAAELWLEYAEETIAESKIKYNFTSEETIRAKRDVVGDMKYLSAWLDKNDLPCNREYMTSFASAEVFSVSDLLEAYQQGKYAFTRVLAYFNEDDRVKLLALVQSGSTVTHDLT